MLSSFVSSPVVHRAVMGPLSSLRLEGLVLMVGGDYTTRGNEPFPNSKRKFFFFLFFKMKEVKDNFCF